MKMLCIYADYKSDESYTPSKISVRVGHNFHNLQEIRVRMLILVCATCCPGRQVSLSFSSLCCN